MKTIIVTEEELNCIVLNAVRLGIKEMTVSAPPKEFGGLDLAEEVTGLKRPTLYAYASQGKIPVMRLGKVLRFSRAELIKWMSEKGQ